MSKDKTEGYASCVLGLLVLAFYAGCLGYNATQPAVVQDQSTQLATWLNDHGLTSGLAPYWEADSVTLKIPDTVGMP